MKKVKVNAYQVGLVFKDDVYQGLLEEGVYWIWNRKVKVYDRQGRFDPPVALPVLLQDEGIAAALVIVQVKDSELVMQFENDILKAVLTVGDYAYWKSIAVQYRFVKLNLAIPEIPEFLDDAMLDHPLLKPYVRMIQVEAYQQAVLFVNGKFRGILEGGRHSWWRNEVPIHVAAVDMRQQQLEINGQEILTRDKAALRINAWAQFSVIDIEKAALLSKDYEKQLYIAVQLALREFVSGYSFDELLEKRAEIEPLVLDAARVGAKKLGVELMSFGIRDIILPGDMKEIMNQVLVAEKKAQANSIMRREETASTRSLLNTARLMEENAMLWKLKEMEYVEKISEKISQINVNGNGILMDQLKQIFSPQK